MFDEVSKDVAVSQLRYVLHCDEVGPSLSNKPAELKQHAPVTTALWIASLTVGRKGLTRSAAGQKRQIRIRQLSPDFGPREGTDVGLQESGGIVRLIGVLAVGIHVDTKADLDSGLFQAVGQATRTAEQVHGLDLRLFHCDSPRRPSPTSQKATLSVQKSRGEAGVAIVYRLDEGANDVPQSEFEVLKALSRLADDWLIFHSVRWQSLRAGRQGDGEADFVVAHRLHGILVLEVKGGDIGIKTGQWQSVDRRGQVHAIKNPYTQATQSKHALIRFLAEADHTLARIPVVHAVAFPDVETDANLGPAATAGITLFSSALLDPEPALLKVFSHWGSSQPHSSAQLRRLVELLAPTVSVRRVLSLDLKRTESELLRLTASQQRGFSRLRSVGRLLVLGGPGTGKTLLAVERARLLADQGGRVLVVCYNDLLSRVIGAQLHGLPQVEVATFHRLCLSRLRATGTPIPGNPSAEWWEVDGALALRHALSSAATKYDALIVDEGQDFSSLWFDALMAGLANPDHGQVYVFADDRQELWRRDWKSGLIHFAELELVENCRNSAPIAKCVNAIYGDNPPVAEAPGVPVLTVEYQHGDDLVAMVAELGDHLMREQDIELSDLTILTDDARLAERLRDTYVGTAPIVSFGRTGVVCETVGRFKGLEAPAVLLVLSGRSGTLAANTATAYIGLSRARALAVVLMPGSHPAAPAIVRSTGRK